MTLLCAVTSMAWGQTPIASGTFDGKNATYTEGWTTTGTGVGRTDCIIIGAGENITSPALNLSSYKKITVSIKARRYGTLSDSKATIDVSIGGTSVGTVDATGTNANTQLDNIEFTPSSSMTNAVLVFTCTNATSAGSSHGAGINSITVTGTTEGGETVEIPTFSPAAGTYTEAQTVTISCATSGAAIYYTTDGVTPSASSTEYSAPITISKTTTIKAIAIKNNVSSSVASATYTIEEPAEGKLIASGEFDGKNESYPEGWTTTGTGKNRTDCIIIGADENITSPAFDLSKYSKVIISIKARRYGSLSGSKATIDVTIGGTSVGTVDATGTNANTQLDNIEFTPTTSMTAASLIFTCTNATSPGSTHGAGINSITIRGIEGEAASVPAPVFNPKEGTYYTESGTYTVEITCEKENTTIYYTKDGTEPTTDSQFFGEGIVSVTLKANTTTTIKAMAVDEEENFSEVSSATYTINAITVCENLVQLAGQTEADSYLVDPLDAVVTYVNGNYAYIEDGSGAIMLYKKNHGLKAGQTISGSALVNFQLRNGNPQITDIDLTDCAVEDGDAPDPEEIVATEWDYDFDTSILNRYFKVTGATITKENNKYYIQLGNDKVQLFGQGDASTISVADLSVTYTITGFPTMYNTTKELQIFVQPESEGTEKISPLLGFEEELVIAYLDEGAGLPALTNDSDVPLFYTSSNEDVATIDEEGIITLVGVGSTIITAYNEEDDQYLSNSASFTLIVKERRVLPEGTLFYETFNELSGTGGRDGEFSGTVGNGGFNNADGSNTTDETWIATEYSGAAKQCAKLGTGNNASVFSTGAIALTGDGTLTFEAAGWGDEKTNKLTVSATNATVEGDVNITLTNGEWKSYTVAISDATGEVYITFAGKRGFIDEVKVTNEKTTILKDPKLSFEKSEYTAVYGEEFAAPTLSNQYSVTVTYSSSNENVATVDATTGAVTLVGAGETTITATSEANETYEAGSASYKLTVTEPETPIEDNNDRFTLVEDYSTLKAGDQIVLVGELTVDASTTYYGMSSNQKTSNRGAVQVTYNTDETISGNTALQTITLEGVVDEWLFNVGNGYLYAAGNDKNLLLTEEVADDNAKASISAEEGIIFKGNNKRNQLRFNPNNGSPLFSCYASGQQDVKIYRKKAVVAGIPGDANDDGIVSVADVMLAVNKVLNRPGLVLNEKNADVNNDGSITVADVMLIVKLVLKKE